MLRRHWLQVFVVAAVLGLLAASLTTRRGQTSPSNGVSEFPQPERRKSSGGILKTTLRASIADNTLTDNFTGETRVVHALTFEGTIPGPTLVVEPGDTLSIDMPNDLPPNPQEQRDGAFPHDPYTINLHTHGLEVSPLGISDNVFRHMEPGTNNHVKVEIPRDHPTGTYWYHTHKHGSVTTQFFGGMAGFLIIKGGPGTLDALPEIKAAKDVVMGFQVIRSDLNGNVPFVNQESGQFGTFPGPDNPAQQGPWSTYGTTGSPNSYFYYTTNGKTNPTMHMRPGEVQRWRLLNATEGDNLPVALQGHNLNIVAMDGITAANVNSLSAEAPVVVGPGQRYDVLVKADKPGTYLLQALDPFIPESVSPSGIDPDMRPSRHSADLPQPCDPLDPTAPEGCDPTTQLTYPLTLATVVVEGDPVDMSLPSGPLPVPTGLPSVEDMINTPPAALRNVAFENCGKVPGEAGMATVDTTDTTGAIVSGVGAAGQGGMTGMGMNGNGPQGGMTGMGMNGNGPQGRVPSCGWYFEKYDAEYWGGKPFITLLLMRDDDDKGVPNPDPNMPLVNFQKEGLFDPDKPLFPDMIADNYEEWTVVNRSFTDHPFHIHQNPFLLTKINGKPLETPEWHDTILVPASQPTPTGPNAPQPNINLTPHGSITFRIHFRPITVGCFVMHCHIITHEDLGMMQRLDILPGPNESSQCEPETMSH
jgi:FtsP/CotA-like multicopper oxidase with cupredoxin domain